MKNLANLRIQKMKAYNPPLYGRRIFSGTLLDFNERTIPPSPKILKAVYGLLKSNKLQLYPEYGDLENKYAQYAKVSSNQVMITNGSDQAIDLIFRTFTDQGDTVIIPSPSFAMFFQSAQIVGNNIICPKYKKSDLAYPTKELLEMIGPSVKLIVICNPNNPTGTAVTTDFIEKVAQKAPTAIILVDEAYFEFSGVTAAALIKKYPNIIVTRTLSKAFGLPSLRVGFVIASKKYIGELLKVRGPFDVNMIAYTASLTALDDLDYVQKYANEVMNQAKPMVEKFFTKNSVAFYKSCGNFLLYKPIQKQEEIILKENGFLVRPQNKPGIENTLRITIGTVAQMRRFINIYQDKILNKSKAQKYAFLDRDGTLIFEPQDTFQIDSLEKLRILDGVIDGLKQLVKQEYKLIMISNQDGLGTSVFPQINFDAPQNKMLQIFERNGITFSKIFICPHLSQENCNCRKPKTGLIKKFFKDNKIDKSKSFVCGDRTSDKLYAKNIGIQFVRMKTNTNFYQALVKGGIIL